MQRTRRTSSVSASSRMAVRTGPRSCRSTWCSSYLFCHRTGSTERRLRRGVGAGGLGASGSSASRASCAIGSWGRRRPSLGGDVTVMGATDGATAAGGRPCWLVCPPARSNRRRCSPAIRWTWSRASPVGYALRTPTHSAMFGAHEQQGALRAWLSLFGRTAVASTPGDRCLSMGDYVTGPGAARGATAAGGR